jgi:hypothetical protein
MLTISVPRVDPTAFTNLLMLANNANMLLGNITGAAPIVPPPIVTGAVTAIF